jgi:hypothetical protein
MVLVGIVVEGIEAAKAQVTGQLSQVYIQYEAYPSQGAIPEDGNRAYVERFELGIDRDPVAIVDAFLKACGFAIDQDQVYFSMWYAKGFYKVFYRWMIVEMKGDVAFDLVGFQEIVQFFIEPYMCCYAWHLDLLFSARTIFFAGLALNLHLMDLA